MNAKKITACLFLLGLNTTDTVSHVKSSDPVENLFTTIYETNSWLSQESVSGPGSELRVTRRMIMELSALLKRYERI